MAVAYRVAKAFADDAVETDLSRKIQIIKRLCHIGFDIARHKCFVAIDGQPDDAFSVQALQFG